jgi:hypothetical protein
VIAITKWSIGGRYPASGHSDRAKQRSPTAWSLARPWCRPTSPGPFFTHEAPPHEAPPPRGPLAPVGVVTMLPETVPSPSNKGRHIQFENEACRIERRTSPRRGVAARPRSHSPHGHALAIDVNDARNGPTQSLLNPLGTDLRHRSASTRGPLRIPLIFSGRVLPRYRAFNAQFSELDELRVGRAGCAL